MIQSDAMARFFNAQFHCLAWVSKACVAIFAPWRSAIASVPSALPESTTKISEAIVFTLARHASRFFSSLNVSTTTAREESLMEILPQPFLKMFRHEPLLHFFHP